MRLVIELRKDSKAFLCADRIHGFINSSPMVNSVWF